MANLPDHILSNIFIWLPAKKLAQMRSLSKPWNTFLSQPSFIKSHLDHSIHKNDEILVVFYHGFSFDNKPHPPRSPHLQLTNSLKLMVVNKPPGYNANDCDVIGSVNGLICFEYRYYCDPVFYIWNPSLSALLPLPPYTKPSSQGYDVYFRFGFDPKTDDYKVVKLTRPVPLCGYVVKGWLKVQVYSMRKGVWKLINQRFPSSVAEIFNEQEVCVDGYDGHLHWLGVNNNDLQTIVVFDLGVETFSEISLPDSIQYYDENRSNVLGILSGKLCLISHVIDGECDVWVMDHEYGVTESWVKHYVFSQDCGIQNSIGFTLNNEFLFKDNDDCLSSYDPRESKVISTNKVMVDPIQISYQTKIVRYVDSLVWVKPFKQGLDGRGMIKKGFKRKISLKRKSRKVLQKKD